MNAMLSNMELKNLIISTKNKLSNQLPKSLLQKFNNYLKNSKMNWIML